MHRKIHLVATSLVLAVMVSSAAFGYALLSPARRWTSLPRNVRVDNRGLASVNDSTRGVTAAVNAVTRWNTAPGGPTLNIVSSTSASVSYVPGDGISVIIFADPLHICTGNCIAATLTGYYTSGSVGSCDGLNYRRITDSDVSFNTRFNYQTVAEGGTCSSEIYLESVTTHEIGHLIGLGHSGTSSALMYPSVSYCFNKQLATDDRNGRNALYDCSGP
jgi:hypothetical protein